ncbi:MAG: hypothetical protein MHPSP_001267 [Paramarteilia canceri]
MVIILLISSEYTSQKILSCPPGRRSTKMFDRSLSISICVKCPIGTYSDKYESHCTPCPLSKSTISEGSTSINDCNICEKGFEETKNSKLIDNSSLKTSCHNCTKKSKSNIDDVEKDIKCKFIRFECEDGFYYDPVSSLCDSCSYFIEKNNSNESKLSNILKSCDCPNEYVKVMEKDTIKCMLWDALKRLFNGIKIEHSLMNAKNDFDKISFEVCPPYSKEHHKKLTCSCKYGFKIVDYKCLPCSKVKGNKQDSNNDCELIDSHVVYNEAEEVIFCESDMVKDKDGKCVEKEDRNKTIDSSNQSNQSLSYELPNLKDPFICSKGSYFSFDSDNDCIKCPYLYTTQNNGSTNYNDCSVLMIYKVIALIFGISFSIFVMIILFFATKYYKRYTRIQYDTIELTDSNNI